MPKIMMSTLVKKRTSSLNCFCGNSQLIPYDMSGNMMAMPRAKLQLISAKLLPVNSYSIATKALNNTGTISMPGKKRNMRYANNVFFETIASCIRCAESMQYDICQMVSIVIITEVLSIND